MMAMWKRGVALILCFLETALHGGALFGWPSLVYVLQADQLYIDQCLQTVVFPAVNASSPATSFPDINTVATARTESVSSGIAVSNTRNGFITNMSSDSISAVTIDAVTTESDFSVSTNPGGSRVNADSNDDSDTNDTVILTPQTNIRCQEQKVALSLSYTVATVSFGIGALPIGWFFDHYGLRTTRTLAVFLGVAGYCQMAFATRGLEWIILTGAVFIGIACYTVLLSNFHVATLAGEWISLATAVYAAAMNTSFAYQLVKIAHDAGVTRAVALLTLAASFSVVLFTSWCLLPKDKIDDKVLGTGEHSTFAIFLISWGDITKTMNKVSPNFGGRAGKEESLCSYITSATFIAFLFWFCADFVRNHMMINGYDSWITEIVNGDLKKVTFYTDFLAYGTLAGSLLTPFMGFITDCMYSKYGRQPGGRSLVLLPAAFLSSLFMALVNVPLLFHTETAIFAAGVLFLIAKPLFLSTPALFMSILPPIQYYGVIFGIMNVAGGAASFMVYPYLTWKASVHSFFPVNLFILVSNILAFSFPFMLYYDRRAEVMRKKKRRLEMEKRRQRLQQKKTKSQQLTTTNLKQNSTEVQQSTTEVQQNTTELQQNTTELQQNTTEQQENSTELQQNINELQQPSVTPNGVTSVSAC